MNYFLEVKVFHCNKITKDKWSYKIIKLSILVFKRQLLWQNGKYQIISLCPLVIHFNENWICKLNSFIISSLLFEPSCTL